MTGGVPHIHFPQPGGLVRGASVVGGGIVLTVVFVVRRWGMDPVPDVVDPDVGGDGPDIVGTVGPDDPDDCTVD